MEERVREQQAIKFESMFDTWLNDHRKLDLILRLFVGDMNSSPSRIIGSTMGRVPKVMNEKGYQSSYHVYGWTDDVNPEEMVSFSWGMERELYDYIFFKSYMYNICVKHCDKLQARSCKDNIGSSTFPSDHLPLFVRFSFEKKSLQ